MSDVIERTEQYYDSTDADEFYFRIWGGEDIHVGLYQPGEQDIHTASRRTVATMASKLKGWAAGSTLLDVGAGYGGSCRYLARELGFQTTALNLSKVQNQRDREMNEAQGLADKVSVVDGNFEALPFADASFDLAWSQDAILHSGNRFRVFEEVNRILKPGGEFIFTDPMQQRGADPNALQPVLQRIHLETMGSIPDYREFAEKLGWEVVGIEAMPEQLVNHYSAVLHNLESRHAELQGFVSEDYVGNMKRGLQHWIDAGQKGLLDWGILHFRKPA